MIDAHQHFWRIGHHDCTWPTPDLPAIYRDFLPADLEPLARAVGVVGSIVVQSQESAVDTDWLIAVAEHDPFVVGVVGWTDLEAADASARIAELAGHAKLKGLRPMVQDREDDWLDDPALHPAITAMVAHDLSFDALVRPRHLPSLARLAKRHPALAIVIDHGAKPDIPRGAIEPWREALAPLAALPRVHCKLSGLLTELGPGQRDEAVLPFAEHLVEAFGADRLMWGSDWPVLDLAGNYAAWLEMAKDIVAGLDREARAAIFDGTARRFYRLGRS